MGRQYFVQYPSDLYQPVGHFAPGSLVMTCLSLPPEALQ
jgi:hypothetical protein